MRRSVDEPRSMPDRVSDASDRLAELARAQGRGAPALRSQSGSVLEVVDTSSAPTLIHADAGVGARFQNGAVTITDESGVDTRDLRARTVDSTTTTADSATINLLYASGITCYYALTADTGHFNGVSVNAALTSGSLGTGQINCRDIHQEGFGLFTGGIISTGNIQAPTFNGNPSSETLKKDIGPAPEKHLDAVRRAPIHRYRYRKGALNGVDSTMWRRGWIVEEIPVDAATETPDGPAPELISMLRYAWGAIRELADTVDAQAAELAELRARLP